MEENVAIDTAKQKKFEKSIKGIKKLIEKTKTDPKVEPKSAKDDRRKRKERGLVYLSHIPHGFYEHQMTQYFKQFGVVTNARVIRSRRTGASRGCAFVEFRETAVAQIVAETMNNYLMGKRLIKAVYIPPEKQRRNAMRKHWSSAHNPAAELRLKMKKAYNADKDKKGDLKRAKKILANLRNTKKKLSEMGINYDFFVPVDVPEELKEVTAVKNDKETEDTQNPTHKKKNKKEKEKGETKDDVAMVNKKNKKNAAVKPDTKSSGAKKTVEVDLKKEGNKNKKSLKAKGMKPLEDFITVPKDSDDSDGSEQFDSDEFEKLLASEDDSDSTSEDDSLSEDDEADGGESDNESIEDILPPKKNKAKSVMKIPQKQQQQNVALNKQHQGKRKAAQKSVVSPKKTKFEKQIKQKSNTKQFKKKT